MRILILLVSLLFCKSSFGEAGKFGFIDKINSLESDIAALIIKKRSCNDFTLNCLVVKNNVPLVELYLSALSQGITVSAFANTDKLPQNIQPYASQVQKVFAANQGVDINALDENGLSVLHYAATLNNNEFIVQLIKAGAKISVDKTNSLDPFAFAIMLSFEQSVEALLPYIQQNNFSTDNKDYSYMMLYSYFGNNENTLASLIKGEGTRFNINALDKTGNNYLFYSVVAGNTNLSEYFINNGANPDLVNSFGMSALHFAAAYGRGSTITLLVSKGWQINLQDVFGMSPIFYPIVNKNSTIFESLYSMGASISLTDKTGKAALIYLLQYMPNEIDFLNQNNFNFKDYTYKDGMSLVFYLYSVKLYDVIENLISKKIIDINAVDANKNTILMLASYDNNTDLVDFYLKQGAAVNLQASSGNTALHYAVTPDNVAIVEILVKASADTTIKNDIQFNPIQASVMYLKSKSFAYFVNNLTEFSSDMKAKNYGNIIHNICSSVDLNYTETCQSYAKKLLNVNN